MGMCDYLHLRNILSPGSTPTWKPVESELLLQYVMLESAWFRFFNVFDQIMELTSMRLLHRTSPQDRIDGPPMFKTGISYDVTLALARQLDVPLNDLLWDPV